MSNNLKEYNDYELFMMLKEKNEDAKDIIYKKYSYLIGVIIKKYTPLAKKLQVDYRELVQEANYGFASSLESYSEKKEASLATFISFCIERRIKTLLGSYKTQKHQVELDTLSIDYLYEENNQSLLDILKADESLEPFNQIVEKESALDLMNALESTLTDYEKDVYHLMMQHLNYQEIAKRLKIPVKSADNSIQRIKQKLRKILKEAENK